MELTDGQKDKMWFFSKKNLAVLVTDKNSPTFKKIGRISRYQFGGGVVVSFDDGSEERFCYQNGQSKVRLFYRHYNQRGRRLDEEIYEGFGCGPRGLAQMYRELGGQISEFVDEYGRIFKQRPERLG